MAKEKSTTFMARLLEQAIGQDLQVGDPNDSAAVSWPLLWEWLSTTNVGKDFIKTPPAITITLIPNGVAVRINDRDLARNMEITCTSLGGVFDALESALQSPTTLVKIMGKKEPRLRKRSK